MSNSWRNYNFNNIVKSYYIFGIIAIIYIAVVSSIVLRGSDQIQSETDTTKEDKEEKEQEHSEDMTRSKKLTNRIKLNEKHEKQRELDKQNKLNKQTQFEKQRELEKQKDIQEELERIKQQQKKEMKEHDEEEGEEEEEEAEEREKEEEEVVEEEECEDQQEEEEQFSMFGVSIEKLMDFQRQQDQEEGGDGDDVEESAKIPIVLSFMLDRIKLLDGFKTEGLFRVGGNLKQVEQLATEGFDPFSDDLDTNVNTWASLLKKWIRDLPDPIIPHDLSPLIIEFCNSNNNNNNINNNNNSNNSVNHNNCNNNSNNSENIDKKIENILNMIKPDDHKYVIYKIGEFFGEMLQEDVVEHTKMNIDNLSKILTPSLFKPNNLICGNDSSGNNSPIPKYLTALDLPGILQKQKKEIEFVSCLLSFFKHQHLNKLQQEEEEEEEEEEIQEQE